jgi:hypothetical protein
MRTVIRDVCFTGIDENSLKGAVGSPWVAGKGDDQCRAVGRRRGDVQRPAGNDCNAGA